MTSPTDDTTRILPGDLTEAAQVTLGRLRRRYPGAFKEVKPLALGIRDDIMDRGGFDHLELLHFFDWYSRAPAYLRAQLQPGAMRYDLEGKAVGTVTDENREYAAAELSHRLAQRQDQARYRAFRAALLEPVTIGDSDEP